MTFEKSIRWAMDMKRAPIRFLTVVSFTAGQIDLWRGDASQGEQSASDGLVLAQLVQGSSSAPVAVVGAAQFRQLAPEGDMFTYAWVPVRTNEKSEG